MSRTHADKYPDWQDFKLNKNPYQRELAVTNGVWERVEIGMCLGVGIEIADGWYGQLQKETSAASRRLKLIFKSKILTKKSRPIILMTLIRLIA